jgi:lipid A 3-O-deacylase
MENIMRTALLAAGVATWMLAASPAFAADAAVELRHGGRGDIDFSGVSVRFGELWSSDAGNWKMKLQPVVEGGRFRYSGSRADRDSVSYGGLGVGFRIARDKAGWSPYLELGLGGTYFGQTTIGPRSLSTRFQFTEWIGVGVELGDHFMVGWRYSHYSNANLKKPNDGVDIQQVVVGIRF